MADEILQWSDGQLAGVIRTEQIQIEARELVARIAAIAEQPTTAAVDDIIAGFAQGEQVNYMFVTALALPIIAARLLPELLAAAQAKGVDLVPDLREIADAIAAHRPAIYPGSIL